MTLSGIWENYVFKTRYIIGYHDINEAAPQISCTPLNDLDVHAFLHETDGRLINYLKQRQGDPAWVFFEYYEDGRRLGYSFLHIPTKVEWNDSLPTFPGEARIGSNYVYPEFRGRRVRGEIHKAQFHYANKRDLKLWCVIEKSNTASMKAELKFGYILRKNFLLKLWGKNLVSIMTRPLEIHALLAAKAVRR